MSEAPPPFSMPAPTPKRGNRTLWIVLGILAVLGCGCCGFFGYFGYVAVRDVMPVAGCGLSYTAVRQATLDYAAANKGMLPKAATWQDDVRPFYEKVTAQTKDQPFELMSSSGEWGCKVGDKMTGMSYNIDLSGKKLDDIKEPYETILLFETERPSRNQAGKYVQRPPNSGPTMVFGKNRPWMVMPLKGKSNIDFSNGRMKIEGLEEGGNL